MWARVTATCDGPFVHDVAPHLACGLGGALFVFQAGVRTAWECRAPGDARLAVPGVRPLRLSCQCCLRPALPPGTRRRRSPDWRGPWRIPSLSTLQETGVIGMGSP